MKNDNDNENQYIKEYNYNSIYNNNIYPLRKLEQINLRNLKENLYKINYYSKNQIQILKQKQKQKQFNININRNKNYYNINNLTNKSYTNFYSDKFNYTEYEDYLNKENSINTFELISTDLFSSNIYILI